ncbi:hypothetical protein [Paenibacillus sp. L3-i20]|uniref:hypothetical protein n=1 Tax=Paenibacillus sp. L3-i20 TaxID=2905833 RepID=UPI00208B51AA|nr:hypothetical protein [Paenibacillus sp. L3-i20]GKU79181.1 hypothetical protein L3i20_v235780 [Paenibacillus sp. L3-i20]
MRNLYDSNQERTEINHNTLSLNEKNKRMIPLKVREKFMNAFEYSGKYVKISTLDDYWIIGKILEVEANEIEHTQDVKISLLHAHKQSLFNQEFISLTLDRIVEIEELDPLFLQDLKLTINYVPNLQDIYDSIYREKLPNKIHFGKIE